MTTTRIDAILAAQRAYFATGATLSPAFRIEPTVMDSVTWSDAVMGQEIFGPALPMRYQPYRPFHEKLLRFFLR